MVKPARHARKSWPKHCAPICAAANHPAPSKSPIHEATADMDRILIEGGTALHGTLAISGSKNA
ncbi:MAG: hypothetical protein VYC90_06490, partial [Pseudomonadota bacterium]|nr:hypothetical protein [Pseudomonadota bacterium]